MSVIRPAKITHNNTPNRVPFIFSDMNTSPSVWLREMGPKNAYVDRYKGPYKVLERGQTHFTLEMPSGRSSKQSIELLKPAYMPNASFLLNELTPEQAARIREQNCQTNGHNDNH